MPGQVGRRSEDLGEAGASLCLWPVPVPCNNQRQGVRGFVYLFFRLYLRLGKWVIFATP